MSFALFVLVLAASYPLLSTAGRAIDLFAASLAATVAVIVGLMRIEESQRGPWRLLPLALALATVGNAVRPLPGELAVVTSKLVDAAANALLLAIALVLIVRRGRADLGGVIDSSIAALALGGLLWTVVLQPNLVEAYQGGAAKANLLVIVFALGGVLGALGRLAWSAGPRVRALWLLVAALVLALIGNVVLALSAELWVQTAAWVMFIGVYGLIGLFGLDPSGWRLSTAASEPREERLSIGRLIFLGTAVGVIPVIVGVRAVRGQAIDGILLIVGGTMITILVMVRIGQLAAARTRAEEALTRRATHDPLTGLPNRKGFIEQLQQEISVATSCAVLFCDLNGFKAVNDRLGHAAGDELLVTVAARLRASVRDNDVVSRFGGDEFLMLLRGSHDDVEVVCRRIQERLAEPIVLLGEGVTIGASIGAVAGIEGDDAEQLILRADRAMYEAKQGSALSHEVRVVRA